MVKGNILRRILYAGAGLIILTSVLLPVVIISFVLLDKTGTATPVSAIFGTMVIVILHLLILYAFREALIVNKRNGHLNIAVFIVSGFGLLLLGLIISDGAFEFWGYYKNYPAAMTMFFCIGCDFFAAVIAFTALFLQPKKAGKK